MFRDAVLCARSSISFWVTVLCVRARLSGRLHARRRCRSAGRTSRWRWCWSRSGRRSSCARPRGSSCCRSEGPVNALLQAMHVVDAPLTMIFTRFAVYVAMVHVLLPFVILPLYSVMKGIDPVYMRAAASLGRAGMEALPARLPADDDAGRRGRCADGVHAVGGVLRHAGAGRRPRRPDGQLLHRVLHQPDDQLGHGRGAGEPAAR